MPIVDKPEWIHHGGTAIHGLDIDAAGERIATAGSDNKIRIWSMRPVISEAAELDASVPRQLAVLSESNTPVNCVRFAPMGRLLAAGSDDADGYVFELREGQGRALFGSGEAANIEYWKLRLRLRGHDVNVSDVAWAPDSRRLATASIDNKVKIWDATNGHCIRTLDGHIGHVKGVAWDPFDLYLASQGDHEVIVWRLEDGQPAARITEPFVSAPIVSFTLRPAWSPDGQVLALPNGYEKGVHVVPLIRRNTWAPKEFSLVGHKGPVTVVRYNPHLYLSPRCGGSEGAAADDDAGAGSVPAVGSTDKCFSAWHPEVEKALMVGKGFFKRMINDMAWSADGRVLMVASHDGSVASIVFSEIEVGRRVPEMEVQALLTKLYGDPRLRNQKAALTTAPDLLQLEARARADVEREERLNNRLGPGAPGAAMQPPAAAAPTASGVLRPPVPQPRPPQPSSPTAVIPTRNGPSAQANRIPQQAAAAPPPQPLPPTLMGAQRASSPAKAVAAGSSVRAGAGAVPSGRDPDVQPAKRAALHPVQIAAAASGHPRAGCSTGRPAASANTANGIPAATGCAFGAAAPSAMPAAAASTAATAAPVLLVPLAPYQAMLNTLIQTQSDVAGEEKVYLELQANNRARDSQQRPMSELVCLAGSRRQWSDTLQGNVVALAGSNRLAAAATASGDLMVYSPAGRRLFPPIRLGFPASFLSVGAGSSVLLALLADGQLRVWDFAAGESILDASVEPLLKGDAVQQGLRVSAVRLSSAGSPVVVLSNAFAYMYHMGLHCWMRLADDGFVASAYTTSLSSATTGELSRLQASAARRRNPQDVIAASAAQAARPAAARRSEHALLEHNLAAAAVMQSPAEWRHWLTMYVRQLARDEDESRIRELIAEFSGPLRYGSATHAAAATGRGASSTATTSEPPLASTVVGRWQPSILGFDKRRLLREVVLKEVAKNRTYQQLVAEFLDQLKYVEGAVQPGGPRPPSGTGPAGTGC